MANLQSSLLWKNSDNSFADEGGYSDGVDGKARKGFEKTVQLFFISEGIEMIPAASFSGSSAAGPSNQASLFLKVFR